MILPTQTRCLVAIITTLVWLTFLGGRAFAAPTITQQPQSQTVIAGTNISFSVIATGPQTPFSYKWLFNGTNLTNNAQISGATTNFLNLTGVGVTNAGNYRVVVTDRHANSTTSSVAVLTVLLPPTIIGQPVSQIVREGNSMELSVEATGSGTLAYQWFFYDAVVDMATNPTLAFTNVQLSASGNYHVTVSNSLGVVTSAVATLTVMQPPALQFGPLDTLAPLGATVSLGHVKSGSLPMFVQWQKDGTNLVNSSQYGDAAWLDTLGNNTVLTIAGVSHDQEGLYRVIITNAVGSVTSAVARVSVTPVWAWGGAIAYYTGATATPASATNAIAISAGFDHSLVLRGDGSVIAFGNGESVPVEATNVVAIAAGGGQSLALRDDGSLLAWGGDTSWFTNAPSGLSNLVDIVPGAALRSDGTAIGLGGNLLPDDLTNVVKLSDGLAIRANGTVLCWGNFPQPPASLTNVVAAARGYLTGIALRQDGSLVTWGNDLGIYGTLTVPTSATNVIAVAAGGYHNVLLRRNGTIIGWSNIGEAPPVTNAVAIAAGGNHAMTLIHDPTTHMPARIWASPTSRTAFGGASMVMLGGTGGYPAPQHQWLFEGIPLAGATNRWLWLQNLNPMHAGAYQLVASNSFGVATSAVALVSISGVIDITKQPADQAVINGSTAAFNVTPAGVSPFSYQWQCNGTNLANGGRISGANAQTLTIASAQTNDEAAYRVMITNNFGSITSAAASLTIMFPPAIIVAPSNQQVVLNSNLTFTVVASGSEPMWYDWRRNNASLTDDGRTQGATNATLAISGVQTNDLGNYDVIVSNPYGVAVSPKVSFTILYPPDIATPPTNRTAPAGTNVSFAVTATGTGSIGYQWRFAQTDLPGRTNASLSLTNIQAANAGDYDVVITNLYGAITSSVATLTVIPSAPVFVTQAVAKVASAGQNVLFTAAAKGTEPMTFQWQHEGTNLAGANSATCTLSNVNFRFSGNYRVTISNELGSIVSTNAPLVVSPVWIWGLTNNPQLLLSAAIPATATNVIAIAAAFTTDIGLPCLALRADGSLAPWGYFSRDPVPPVEATNLVAVSLGAIGSSVNSLVLRADGAVINWTSKPTTSILTNQNITAIAAGGTHQLALRDDGTVFAWGSNTSGQTNVPTAATNIIAIAAGNYHSLALRADGTVIGWGLNTSGQATALSNAVDVIAIAAGGNQTMALLADGTVTGRGVTNKIVGANYPPGYGPVTGDISNKIAIAAGAYHGLAIGTNRTVNGWGATNFGQINIPAALTNVLAIAAGGNNSLALVNDPFAPPIPPRIARPPIARSVVAGQSAVFNALAVGGLPLTYQWLRDGVPIAGQTWSSLMFTNVPPGAAGNYQLVAMNAFGAVTSAVMTVTVNLPQPAMKSAVRSNGTFSFNVDGIAGVLYVVEYRDSLETGTWLELESRIGTGSAETIADTNSVPQSRFYRVRAVYPPPP